MCVRLCVVGRQHSPLRSWRSHGRKKASTAAPTRAPFAAQALPAPTGGAFSGRRVRPSFGKTRLVCLSSVLFLANNCLQVDQWDFDPFELEEVTHGHPLVALSTYLFTIKYNLFACFPFSKVRAALFFSLNTIENDTVFASRTPNGARAQLEIDEGSARTLMCFRHRLRQSLRVSFLRFQLPQPPRQAFSFCLSRTGWSVLLSKSHPPLTAL